MKELWTTTPILAYADFTKSFKMHTDASVSGLGAVLYQIHEGLEKFISYASRSLTQSDTKYPVHKLEFLVLKWAITEQFHEYLYGNTFDIYTDNNPLTYVLTTAKLDAMGNRWVASLANYNFHLHYHSGRSNVEADALSKIDWGKDDQTISAESIQATVTSTITGQGSDYINTITSSAQAIESFALPVPNSTQLVCKSMTISEIDSDIDSYHCSDPLWNPNCMIPSDWLKVQAKDPVIHDLIQQYGTKELHKNRDDDSLELKQFLHQRDRLVLRNGILYCKNDTKESECPNWNTMQLVLLTTLRLQALKGCHDDLKHLGIERTLDLLRDHIYWPGMTKDATRHTQHCERCL